MAKLGNPAGVNTILKVLFPSAIMSPPPPPPPNINVEVVAHSQTNTTKTALKLGEGNSQKPPFLFKNIQSDVFAKLFCQAFSEIMKAETKIVARGLKFLK